jgi:hypothetical protein
MTVSWRAAPIPELSGFTVEWAAPGDYILSRRHVLYQTPDLKPPFVEFGRVSGAPHLLAAARLDAVRRALRLSFYNVVRLTADRIFATFDNAVLLVTAEQVKPVSGLKRAFRVLRDGCALTADGSVWFGEYVIEREFAPLRIYRLGPMSERAEIAHVFPGGFARHIHGMYVDPFDRSLWCLTGDADEHAKILRSSDGSEPFVVVGAGDQSWRAVSIQFRRNAIYYATDAHRSPYAIYRIDRATGERTHVSALDGPVYYSHRVGEDLFFGSAAEQPRTSATLWHLDADDRCVLLASFAKDRLPTREFLPGTLSFPSGPGDSRACYFSGVALSGIRRMSFRCAPETGQLS